MPGCYRAFTKKKNVIDSQRTTAKGKRHAVVKLMYSRWAAGSASTTEIVVKCIIGTENISKNL